MKIRGNEENDRGTDIWQKYEKGVDYIHKIDLVNKTDKCHRFYLGDQWYGAKSGGEELPVFNFIKPVVKYKVSTVSQNSMTAVYSPVETQNEIQSKACELLGKHFTKMWERAKMDSSAWKIIKDSAIQGDSYIYFGEGDDVASGQLIDNVNIFLSDERNANLQEQKYIIIRERRFIADIRKEAEANGIDKESLDLITSDDDRQDQIGEKQEVNYSADGGKCISLLYLEKDEEGYVHVSRSVKNLIYQPDTVLKCTKKGEYTGGGLKSYPIINFIWEDKKGSARGCGEVEYLLPNQIEVNKTLARRSIAVKQTAFPKLAYSEGLIDNPEDLDIIGAKIAVTNPNAAAINQIVSYLNPAQISGDAKALSDELISQTRELSGAGDSATGSIDPTQASGTAIIAVRDQAALPLNEQLARYSQFVEDLAYLWFDMWVAYNPNGIEVEGEEGVTETVSADVLEAMKVNVKVDVSKANPFSIYATEQGLLNLMQSGAISFEEMVEKLPEGSALPKGQLQEIVSKRAQQQMEQEQLQQQMAQLQQENQQYSGQLQQMTGALQSATANGGQSNDYQQENEALKKQLAQCTQALETLMAKQGGGENELQGM